VVVGGFKVCLQISQKGGRKQLFSNPVATMGELNGEATLPVAGV
jgi:hypothetical protein